LLDQRGAHFFIHGTEDMGRGVGLFVGGLLKARSSPFRSQFPIV